MKFFPQFRAMQGTIYLDTRENQKRKKGYPVVVSITYNNKQKPFTLKVYYEKEDWNFDKEEPKVNKRDILFIKNKKVVLEQLLFKALEEKEITFDYIKNKLLGKEIIVSNEINFFDFANTIIEEIEKVKDDKGVEKKGNARSYVNAINQLKLYRKNVAIGDIDYNFLNGFKNWQKLKGNKKTTINTYLRKYRALYNEASRRYKFEDEKPFKDIFKGITVKQNRTKKRYVNKAVVKILENISGIAEGQQLAVDLWLLQFYVGGQDFKDIYFLENYQIAKGRVYFIRGKLDEGGYQFDLKLFDKIKRILDKYKEKGQFVFPWRKDYDGYNSFLRRVQKNLVIVQNNYNAKISNETEQKIEVLPLGGNLSPKVTRHTFANFGKRLYVETDLLRELMGHERDDVDTIYKDTYPEEERDEWHHKIIDTKDKL